MSSYNLYRIIVDYFRLRCVY